MSRVVGRYDRLRTDDLCRVPGLSVLVSSYCFYLVFVVSLRDFVGLCGVGHSIYADGIFVSVLYDADDLGSDTYNLVRSYSLVAEFRVTLGG